MNQINFQENFPYQYNIDKKIDEKFGQWAPVFMKILVDIAFKTGGTVNDCKIVMARSDSYREGQDYLAEFAKECIIKESVLKLRRQKLQKNLEIVYR